MRVGREWEDGEEALLIGRGEDDALGGCGASVDVCVGRVCIVLFRGDFDLIGEGN